MFSQSWIRATLVVLVWVACIAGLVAWLVRSEEQRISIAAGPVTGEAFEVASALADVLSDALPRVRVEVFETQGSSENLQLLESGQVDLATLQADARVSDGVQSVAILFEDVFQLIASDASGVEIPPDLRGKRVAIPPVDSGQHRSFWYLMDHYDVQPGQVVALPMSEEASNFAMRQGQVDAVFRVRAPGNELIAELTREMRGLHLVPIEHSAALSIKRPNMHGGNIPRGAYRGDPAMPANDVQTVALQRLLAARDSLDEDLVYQITRALYERRSELVAATPLAGFIRPVTDDAMISVALHEGARRYHGREKPGFMQENARIIAPTLYVIVILSSAFIALRSRFSRARKVRIADYNVELMEIAGDARAAGDEATLIALRDRLASVLQRVVKDLDEERVNEDQFDHFSFTWQAVDSLVRDRSITLQRLGGTA